MLNHLLSRLPRWDRIVTAIFIIIIVITGFYIDKSGWLVNISGEIVGIFLGFLFAILFLEEYQKTKRKEQWEKVRILTYRSLTAHSMDVVNQTIIHYSPLLSDTTKNFMTIGGQRLRPTDITKTIIKSLLDDLNKIPQSVYRKNSKLMVELFDSIRWNLDRISDILFPRVLQFSDNEKIINAMIKLDYARDLLENYVRFEKSNGLGLELVNLTFLLGTIDDLLEILAQNWD